MDKDLAVTTLLFILLMLGFTYLAYDALNPSKNDKD